MWQPVALPFALSAQKYDVIVAKRQIKVKNYGLLSRFVNIFSSLYQIIAQLSTTLLHFLYVGSALFSQIAF